MLQVWSSPLLAKSHLLHFFTTRKGGASKPPYDSLNLGFSSGDLRENVLENRRRVDVEFGVKLRSLAKQVHGDRVLILRKGDPIADESNLPEADAIVGNAPGLSIAMFFADCLPIYFWDPESGAGGLAHAGWRSTIADIGPKTVDTLAAAFGSRPENLRVALGPSIGPCCFEVKSDVEAQFVSKFGEAVSEKRDGKIYVDLWKANASALAAKGVRPEHLEIAGMCTASAPEQFYSYRRDKGVTGRMAGLIKLPAS